MFTSRHCASSLCAALLAVVVPCLLRAQVTDTTAKRVAYIQLIGGKDLKGVVLRESADSVYLSGDAGSVTAVPRSSIRQMSYRSVLAPQSFFEAGGVVGTPAGLNLVFGYRWGRIGFRLSGLYLGDRISGSQLDIPFNLSRTEDVSKDIELVLLQSEISHDNGMFASSHQYLTGFGAAYHANWSGFDWQAGLVITKGTFSSPQLILQIGYVHEFR